jgi:hypothetical protein
MMTPQEKLDYLRRERDIEREIAIAAANAAWAEMLRATRERGAPQQRARIEIQHGQFE